MANLRLFVAVEISEAVRDAVDRELSKLKSLAPKSRFVRADKLHVTLVFLGWVDDSRLDEMKRALDEAAKAGSAHLLSVEGGGGFGSKKAPTVLWIGIGGNLDALRVLQKSVEGEYAKLGFEPEKRAYSPHLTLARAGDRRRGDRHLAQCVEALQGFDAGKFKVSRVVLMQSVQDKSGGKYVPVHEMELPKGAQ